MSSSHFTKLKCRYNDIVNFITVSVQDGIIQEGLFATDSMHISGKSYVMLLGYGYFVRRHDIRSAIKAVGTLKTVYQCSSWEDLMMALSCLWMNGHCHRSSRTCTLVHTHAHQRNLDEHFRIQCSNWDEFD